MRIFFLYLIFVTTSFSLNVIAQAQSEISRHNIAQASSYSNPWSDSNSNNQSNNQTTEAPSKIIVSQVRAQGSGCPAGTVSGNISPDGSAFSLLMDNYQALSNGNNQLDRKMCEVMVDFSLDPGWSYALVSADYRGFVNVANGSVATHQAIYSFDGSRPINERPGFQNGRGHLFKGQEFRGPISDNYFIHTDLNPAQAPWSKCVWIK